MKDTTRCLIFYSINSTDFFYFHYFNCIFHYCIHSFCRISVTPKFFSKIIGNIPMPIIIEKKQASADYIFCVFHNNNPSVPLVIFQIFKFEFYKLFCNGVQREHNKKLNNGLPILHKVPPKRDYGRYFCILAEKGGTSHGGLTEKLSPFFTPKNRR